MSYTELRAEFESPSFMALLDKFYPHRCINCGSDKSIEYHHIVPLEFGGTNKRTNIRPLCHKCHLAAHGCLGDKA